MSKRRNRTRRVTSYQSPMGLTPAPNVIVEDTGWDSGLKVIDSCGNCGDVFPIVIPPDIFGKIIGLMQAFTTEWLAYLREENNVVVEMVVPQQVAGLASCEPDRGAERTGWGVIHSHVEMGAFFSVTDRTELNPNAPFSVVVSWSKGKTGLEWQAVRKIKVPCGASHLAATDVLVADDVEFLSAAKEAIKERTVAVVPHHYSANGYGGYVGGHLGHTYTDNPLDDPRVDYPFEGEQLTTAELDEFYRDEEEKRARMTGDEKLRGPFEVAPDERGIEEW